MGETLNQGFLITGLGMGLVFAMIIVLWGLMALLVILTNQKKEDENPDEIAIEEPSSAEVQVKSVDQSQLAAAIAVAYAQQIATPTRQVSTSTTGNPVSSAWLSSGRIAQTLRNSNKGRK